MQLKPPQVFPDRSVDVGEGGMGQQQMAQPYVPAGLGFTKVTVFAPRVCCDKTWTALSRHAATAESSAVLKAQSRT